FLMKMPHGAGLFSCGKTKSCGTMSKKDWGIRDEKNTLDVGILDIAPNVYQNEKEIASIYAHKRIY
ncbi:hypothetical protein, partial [Anaerotignum lactatifermentans]|uniref:hypothetical protein n=1 Tax=Anaerotignum lactatifermentans TaxID=160404 RepID=UPI003AEFE911